MADAQALQLRQPLRGGGTEIGGDDPPLFAVTARCRQMQHDPAHRGLHPRAKLEQMLAQGADLRRSIGGARRAQPQLLIQHVRCGAQQPAQLIAQEPAAAGAVDFQTMMP